MDRRTQRLILLILLFGVAVVLYRSLGSASDAVRRRPGSFVKGPAGDSVASYALDITGLEPANSTLGVCLFPSFLSRPPFKPRVRLILAPSMVPSLEC